MGLIWGVWTIVALFFNYPGLRDSFSARQPVRFGWSFGGNFLYQTSACYLVGARARPLVLWLARRFRIERTNWLRRVGLAFLVRSSAEQSFTCIESPNLQGANGHHLEPYAVQRL